MGIRKIGVGLVVVGLAGLVATTAFAEGFTWPVSGTITATHVYAGGAYHSGSADIGAPYWRGIGASHRGWTYARWESGGCGYYVSMSHGNGYTSLYCHMVRWPSTWNGRYVYRNTHIGYVGSTGHSTGPHVHFAIRRWGVRYRIPNIWRGKWVNRGYICAYYAGV